MLLFCSYLSMSPNAFIKFLYEKQKQCDYKMERPCLNNLIGKYNTYVIVTFIRFLIRLKVLYLLLFVFAIYFKLFDG